MLVKTLGMCRYGGNDTMYMGMVGITLGTGEMVGMAVYWRVWW